MKNEEGWRCYKISPEKLSGHNRKGDLREQANQEKMSGEILDILGTNPEKMSGEILDILGTNPANLRGRECLARSYSRACSWS